MKLRQLLLTGAIASIAAIGATTASAATFIFTFAGNGSLNGATGTITTGSASSEPGAFDITDITGTVFGPAFEDTGAIVFTPAAPMNGNTANLSPSGKFYYDDLLYPTTVPRVDNNGVLFQVNGQEFNLFSVLPYDAPGGYSLYEYSSVTGNYSSVNGDFAISEVGGGVPEPATWALMLAGFGLSGAALRSMRKQTAVAA